MISKVPVVFIVGILMVVGDVVDWTAHCDRCKCTWSGGKKFADCRNAQLTAIPKTLSNELRDIDFSSNRLYELKAREFSEANLSDVHKLKLNNCSIQDISRTAFEGLSLLIELELTYNEVRKLDSVVFRSNSKLRVISLTGNLLTSLGDDLFANMTHLQKIYLNNNQIENISSDVFGPNCTVQHIDLSYNKLKIIDGSFLDHFHKMTSLTLEGNPWVCDCHLEAFRSISVAKNLVTTYTECNEPERLRGRVWNDHDVVFACSPEILELNATMPIEANSLNYTISCKVKGDPIPDIEWTSNGRIVDRDPRQNVQKYITIKKQDGSIIWNNLTIVNFSHRDRGEYKCIAKNPGGTNEGNITLSVRPGTYVDGTYYTNGTRNNMPWIIGLIVGSIILLFMIMILIYCCCKRNGRGNNALSSKTRGLGQSNEFISLDGHQNDMGKSLITEVNPVVKPPRQYSGAPSVTSGGTEVSEVKKMLMDDDSSFAGDEESRSLEFESRYPTKLPSHISDYRRENHYPPDLLSFPPHAIPQVSPAGSSASTVADTSRLPASHGPQSPLHSPLYDSIYRTLPYSRSHSPFTSPHGPPVRVHRQGGYVTIPRRPRQSWSSEPPVSDLGEPLYDNLGLRTTATGSSALSLNRIGDNPATPKTSTPNNKTNIRPVYPLSPNLVSIPCDPIAEHDSPPTATTLPRSASAHRALSPNADAIRANWTRSPETVDSRRESTASLLPTPDGKTPKIPPRPPPKPKKRASTGPLFEDEGEDGTEV